MDEKNTSGGSLAPRQAEASPYIPPSQVQRERVARAFDQLQDAEDAWSAAALDLQDAMFATRCADATPALFGVGGTLVLTASEIPRCVAVTSRGTRCSVAALNPYEWDEDGRGVRHLDDDAGEGLLTQTCARHRGGNAREYGFPEWRTIPARTAGAA